MPSLSISQLTVQFEPELAQRFPTLRDFVAYRAMTVAKPIKAQAADMDLSPSTLSRKLNPGEGDTQRFNVDDLDAWLASTGDVMAIVKYLVGKYTDTPEARQQRTLAQVEQLAEQLAVLTAQLKQGR